MKLPPRITARLRQEFGLDERVFRGSSLDGVVRRRMEATGIDGAEDYFLCLRNSDEEFIAFSDQLLVPESWFFRDGKPFSWLVHWAKKTWRPANPGQKLRILSVPCATGQEPYSIAMALLGAGFAPQSFHIEAGDLSQRFVDEAQRAEYRPIAFRSGIPTEYGHFFEETEGGLRRVRAEVRAVVSFRQRNLLAGNFLLGEAPFDVIFCRNVLIYFSAESRARAVTNLMKGLADDGLMFAGHADALGVVSTELGPVGPAGAFCFSRRAVPAPVMPRSVKRASETTLKRRKPARKKTAPRPVNAPVAGPSAGERWAEVRALANGGRLEEAEHVCQDLMKSMPLSADAFCTLGEIYAAQRRPREAEQIFRRAVYLDARHAQSLFHLALLAERRGDRGGAERLRRRARSAEASEEVKA